MNAYSAVACAVANATGTLFTELPLTPDRVMQLLERKKGGKE
jgi:CO/xanthine dehydrogenase Mo-binding subunit